MIEISPEQFAVMRKWVRLWDEWTEHLSKCQECGNNEDSEGEWRCEAGKKLDDERGCHSVMVRKIIVKLSSREPPEPPPASP